MDIEVAVRSAIRNVIARKRSNLAFSKEIATVDATSQ